MSAIHLEFICDISLDLSQINPPKQVCICTYTPLGHGLYLKQTVLTVTLKSLPVVKEDNGPGLVGDTTVVVTSLLLLLLLTTHMYETKKIRALLNKMMTVQRTKATTSTLGSGSVPLSQSSVTREELQYTMAE